MDFTSNEQEIVDYLMQFTTKESKALQIPGNQNGHYGKSLELQKKDRQTWSSVLSDNLTGLTLKLRKNTILVFLIGWIKKFMNLIGSKPSKK